MGKLLMLWTLQPVYSGKLLITNPDRFFGELSGRASNPLAPFVIVLITATISAVSTAMMPYSSGAAVEEVAIRLITPFIWWFLCAGAVYAFSIFFRGVGSFKRVLEFTGYGFIPQIPSAIFNALIMHALLPLLASLPPFTTYVIAIIGLLLLLWGAAIWIFAVKHARNISTRDALFAVIGGVVAGVLLMLVIIGVIASTIH